MSTSPEDTSARVLRAATDALYPFRVALIEGRLDETSARVFLDFARDVIRADYRADVKAAASDIAERILDREIETRDDLEEAIHETVDGHSRVIYTRSAMEGLIHGTDNAGAYAEQFGTDGLTEDGDIAWSRLMYAAMEADVRDELSRVDGIDLDADDLGVGSEAEEEESAEAEGGEV